VSIVNPTAPICKTGDVCVSLVQEQTQDKYNWRCIPNQPTEHNLLEAMVGLAPGIFAPWALQICVDYAHGVLIYHRDVVDAMFGYSRSPLPNIDDETRNYCKSTIWDAASCRLAIAIVLAGQDQESDISELLTILHVSREGMREGALIAASASDDERLRKELVRIMMLTDPEAACGTGEAWIFHKILCRWYYEYEYDLAAIRKMAERVQVEDQALTSADQLLKYLSCPRWATL
jgi:hypothetical protein